MSFYTFFYTHHFFTCILNLRALYYLYEKNISTTFYWNATSGWTSITNLGSKINSSEDEYRPMVLDVDGNSNFKRVIFFSSNRDGGLGGYDLYYSGL